MKFPRKLLTNSLRAVLPFIAAACMHAAVAIPGTWFTSYTVDLSVGEPVTDIMMLERTSSGGSITWPFSASGSGSTVLENPFGHDEMVVESLLIGLVQDLPGDAPGQKHVVLFMNDYAASNALGIAWGTLFPTQLEDSLIAAIELATSGQPHSIIDPGVNAVLEFGDHDATFGNLGPGGLPGTAWFGPGDSFTAVAFSTGQTIGAGTSQQNFVPTAVPEPASVSTGLAGIGALLLLRRKISR